MGDNSKIEWTDSTWNPVVGCQEVSPGCDHCYARRLVERFGGDFERVELKPHRLDQPLRWRKPRRVFVNSMSDLFHDAVPDDYIAKVFAVMAAASQHTFQVLTKRHGRMRSLMRSPDFRALVGWQMEALGALDPREQAPWPLPNVWLGVSVEDQKWADLRIPALKETPAAVRFLSCEPLLGPIERLYLGESAMAGVCVDIDGAWWHPPGSCPHCSPGIDWIIVGGESGPDARPMSPSWPRSIRDACQSASVPFLFKQWGEWSPGGSSQPNGTRRAIYSGDQPAYEVERDTAIRAMWTFGGGIMTRRGKKAAGREIDGRTYDEYPRGA